MDGYERYRVGYLCCLIEEAALGLTQEASVVFGVFRCEGELSAAQLLQTHPQRWKLPELCKDLPSPRD